MRLNRLLLLLAIIVPIIACVICLKALKEINEEKSPTEETTTSTTKLTSETNGGMVEVPISSGNATEEPKTVQSLAGVEFYSTIGSPTSIIYTDASVASGVANVYKEAREQTDEIIDTRTKYDVLKAAQKFPQGWTRVQTDKVSGWMRTENITFPDRKDGLLSDDSVIGKIGTVTADPNLRMRASGSMDAEVLTSVPHDATFTILDSVNGWYKVTYASTTGWVSAEYVEVK